MRQPRVYGETRGTIRASWDVFCGCADWAHTPGRTAAQRKAEARAMGWVWTVQKGWICPRCQLPAPARLARLDGGGEGG